MDILEESFPKNKIVDVMNILEFGNNPIQLVGTGSMASQFYPADYDFLSKIKIKYNRYNSYLLFKNILKEINDDEDLFFVEFKIQDINDNKYKIFKIDEFTKPFFDKNFNNVKLCKIDCIINIDNIFKEVSCIYFFLNEALDRKEYAKTLLKDQLDYYEEKNYYKSLKRLMLAGKYEDPPDKSLIMAITQLFNSQVGVLYQLKNEIDAAIIFRDKYNDNESKERIKLFLKNIGLDNVNPDNLEKVSKEYDKIIQREALKFYEYHNLKVNKLPKYNSIKPIFEMS
jgi:hypothetical protein